MQSSKRILLTGANGYVGKRLLPDLVAQGHHVICTVRDKSRFTIQPELKSYVTVIEVDFLNLPTLNNIPRDIDAAYYLIHSMSDATGFSELEERAAINFRNAIEATNARQVIYLSGIVHSSKLSPHLQSRKAVAEILSGARFALTVLRAAIIVGSGSASFEIIRDLSEKLPVMVAPKWISTKCQPIGIRDVIAYLGGVLLNDKAYNRSFDIGGADVLTYKQMLEIYAEVRKLPRKILMVPVLTPRLSSYWLFLLTSVPFLLAVQLVESMRHDVVVENNDIHDVVPIIPMGYRQSIELAFKRIEQNNVTSSWMDSVGGFARTLTPAIEVPKYGILRDSRAVKLDDPERALNNIFSIGGGRGWFYADWLWGLRGFLDRIFGGVGLNRGRRHPTELASGDAVDFWRVIFANREEKRLVLFAEMKTPGEAWLEFCIDDKNVLHQTATFRPKGLLGRAYWTALLPFHYFLFRGMAKAVATAK